MAIRDSGRDFRLEIQQGPSLQASTMPSVLERRAQVLEYSGAGGTVPIPEHHQRRGG